MDKKHCFIITPIGDENDPIRRHIEGIIDAAIIPAIGDIYDIIVAHKISEPGSITKQIITEIYNSELIIANLTNRNPNVMYELALRHAIGKPAIMIAEKGTNLPSDIIMQRVIFYHNDAKGVLELRDQLKETVDNINLSEKSGPIYDVLGDISHDTDLLQKMESIDADNIKPFEYILRRLNRIEDAVIHSRRREENTPYTNNYPHIVKMSFVYDSFDYSKLNKRALKTRLALVDRIDSDAFVHEVLVNQEQNSIDILLNINGPIAVPEIYHYFMKVFSEFGLRGVKAIDAESCISH